VNEKLFLPNEPIFKTADPPHSAGDRGHPVEALRRGGRDAARLEIERKRMGLARLPMPCGAAPAAEGQGWSSSVKHSQG